MLGTLLSLSGQFCHLQVCNGLKEKELSVVFELCPLICCFAAFRLRDFSLPHAADQSGKRRPADPRHSLRPQLHSHSPDHCGGRQRRPSFPSKPHDSDQAREHPRWQRGANGERHWPGHFAAPDHQVRAEPSHFHPSWSGNVFCAQEFACRCRIMLKFFGSTQ